MRRLLRTAALAGLATVVAASSAAAADWAGSDPASNYRVTEMPASCAAPTSPACIDASVAQLDQARARLGQPPYQLPSNFDSLAPIEQGFVLTNLDRILSGLRPMTGLTPALNRDAAAGMVSDSDPEPSASNYLSWTSNWAGGALNMPLAYEEWMYDDGPGSGNLDCSSPKSPGCWGHRHDVLWKFDGSGPLAMGSAAGSDSGGERSYTLLLFEGDQSYAPRYSYTWAQAVAAGASGGNASSSRPATNPASPPVSVATRARVRIASLHARGRRVAVTMAAPSAGAIRCALTRHLRRGWARDRFHLCSPSVVLSAGRPGRYRLRVRAGNSSATRYLRIR